MSTHRYHYDNDPNLSGDRHPSHSSSLSNASGNAPSRQQPQAVIYSPITDISMPISTSLSPRPTDQLMSSSVQLGRWPYPSPTTSNGHPEPDTYVYPPVSPASYADLHSPVESNMQSYTLSGALELQPTPASFLNYRQSMPHRASDARHASEGKREGSSTAIQIPASVWPRTSSVTDPSNFSLSPSNPVLSSTSMDERRGTNGGNSLREAPVSVPSATGFVPVNYPATTVGVPRGSVGSLPAASAFLLPSGHHADPSSQRILSQWNLRVSGRAPLSYQAQTLVKKEDHDYATSLLLPFEGEEGGDTDADGDGELDCDNEVDNFVPVSPASNLHQNFIHGRPPAYTLSDVPSSAWPSGSHANPTGLVDHNSDSSQSNSHLHSSTLDFVESRSAKRSHASSSTSSYNRDSSVAEGRDDEDDHQTVKVLVPSSVPGEPPKKVKMHQCPTCGKLFPRPSGLKTHMNSHSGARPYKCPLPMCPKTFAVRSNARRHLRTHGITVPPPSLSGNNGRGSPSGNRGAQQPFQVGFDEPVVVDVHDFGRKYISIDDSNAAPSEGASSSHKPSSAGRLRVKGKENGDEPQRLRWIPPSLADRSNADRLRSISPLSDMGDIDAEGSGMEDSDDESNGYTVAGSSAGPSSASDSLQVFHLRPGESIPLSQIHIDSRRGARLKIASAPLPPVRPSEPSTDIDAKYEERDSYAEAGTYPYHPEQVTSSIQRCKQH